MARDICVTKTRRLSYSGGRQFVISSRLCGLLEPIVWEDDVEVMKELTKGINPKDLDCILGLDSAGIPPAIEAGYIMNLPVRIAYKMNLDEENDAVRNKIEFKEPGSPNPNIYVYNLPEGSRVLLIDDEIMTGDTIINCIDSIAKAGSIVKEVIVPLESTRFGARERLADKGYELISYVKHDL